MYSVDKNASLGSFNSASLHARFTTFPARISRSMVVLPVPGGPLTPTIPRLSDSSVSTLLTANCWLNANPCVGLAGHRPRGICSALVPSFTTSGCAITSMRWSCISTFSLVRYSSSAEPGATPERRTLSRSVRKKLFKKSKFGVSSSLFTSLLSITTRRVERSSILSTPATLWA